MKEKFGYANITGCEIVPKGVIIIFSGGKKVLFVNRNVFIDKVVEDRFIYIIGDEIHKNQ